MEQNLSKKQIEKRKRIENYENEKGKFIELGYEEKIETISVLKANLFAFVTAGPFAILAIVIYFMKWQHISFFLNMADTLIFFTLIIVSIVVHELIHGIGWRMCCKNGWKSIHFGVIWKWLAPYCHCKEPLKFKSYIFGGLLPFFILGILMFLIALITGNSMLLIISIINILAAGGDTTIAFILLKYQDAEILDHPTQCGFVAFRKR